MPAYEFCLGTEEHAHRRAIEFINKNRENGGNFRVVDVGGAVGGWSKEVVDAIVDINFFSDEKINLFQGDINEYEVWEKVISYTENNGKFDFCICSHTLEDIRNPVLVCKMIQKIAKQGYISVPSKYRELSRLGAHWRGFIHHRWIYTKEEEVFVGYPKLSFIENQYFNRYENTYNDSLYNFSFFWKEDFKFKIINDDYMGPSPEHVINMFTNLIKD